MHQSERPCRTRSAAPIHRATRRILSEPLESRRLLTGTISGRVLNDVNGDSFHNATETGLANYPVYVDLNKNNAYDSGDILANTDATGTFKLTGVPQGSYVTVKPLPVSGYLNSGSSAWSMMLTTSRPDFVEGDMFSVTQKSVISGIVARDDANFSSLEGQLVYLDQNNNSQRDANEQFTVTSSAGSYNLGGLSAGTYRVRIDPSADLGPAPASVTTVTVSGGPFRYAGGRITISAPAGPTIGVYQSDGTTMRLTHVTSVAEGGSLDLYTGNSTGATGTYQWDANYLPGQPFTADFTGERYLYSADPSRDGNATAFLATRMVSAAGVPGPTHVTIIDILNAPPTGTFVGSTTQAGQPAGVQFTNVTDPSAADAAALTFSYDFDNDGVFDLIGSASGSATLPAGQADTPGVYTMRGRITDKDGGYTDYSTTVTVTPPPNGTIHALLFNDLDNDGVQETGEAVLPGRTVFLDTDNDNVIDTGEPMTTTDENGIAGFVVSPGTYNVRQVLPAGWRFTNKLAATVAVAGGATTDVALGSQLITAYDSGMSGVLFNDINGNGTQDTGEAGLSGRTVFDDRNNNGLLDIGERSAISGSNGVYFIGTYEPGAHVVRQVLPSGWEQTSPTAGAGYAVDVSAHISYPGRNFGSRLTPVIPPDPATATIEAETGTFAGGTAKGSSNGGFTGTGYADFAGSGSSAAWSISRNSAGAVTLSFRYTNGGTADRPLAISVNGVAIGTLSFPPTGSWTAWKTVSIATTLAAGANLIKAVAGNATGANLDSLTISTRTPPPPPTASLSGFTFDDADKDGVYDPTETKTSGRTVFIDLDRDGVLDANEQRVTTDANGAWSFGSLPAGDYAVRQVFASGTAVSTPLINITLANGQAVSGLSIGTKTVVVPPSGKASISGTTFNDNNKNGKYDSGDGIGKGVVMFLDADNDGTFDGNETSVVTDNSGRFTFTGLAAGTYRVRRVLAAGQSYSTPLANVTLTAGQVKTGVLVGTKKA